MLSTGAFCTDTESVALLFSSFPSFFSFFFFVSSFAARQLAACYLKRSLCHSADDAGPQRAASRFAARRINSRIAIATSRAGNAKCDHSPQLGISARAINSFR
jgi:hypothetical protein